MCLSPSDSLSPNPRVGIFGATRDDHRNRYVTDATASRSFAIAMAAMADYGRSYANQLRVSQSFTSYGMYNLHEARWGKRRGGKIRNQTGGAVTARL